MKKHLIYILFLLSGISSFAQQATFKGSVQNEAGQPIENVMIVCLENNATVFSSDQGRFKMQIPANRNVQLMFQHVTFSDTIIPVYLSPNEDRDFDIRIVATNPLDGVTITEQFADSYTRIDPKISFNMPSPTGGVEAIIKSMPGTSSTNELSSQYNVRGGNYDENLIFVNDIQIYRPFLVRSAQQEGLGFVNLDLTEHVKFSAGGFEAGYGDKMSSVLDVQYKRPKGFGGSISGSLLGASVHAEGNAKDKFTYLVGIRYKTNSYLLKSMETKGTYKPNFFDTQLFLTWKLTPKWSMELLGNFSRNQYKYIPEDRETNFGTIESLHRLNIYFDGQEVDRYENYLGGLTLKFHPNERHAFKMIVSSYYARETETFDLQSQYWLSDIEADLGSEDDDIANVVNVRGYGTFLEHARNRLSAVVSSVDFRGEHLIPRNRLEWGVKVQNEIINDHVREWELRDSNGFTLPCLPVIPGVEVPFDDPSRELNFGSFVTFEHHLSTLRLTGFVQTSWTIDKKEEWVLNGGLRTHYWTFNHEFTLSPRLILTHTPHWKHIWVFRLKAGSYYQPAFYREMRRPDGSLNFNIHSPHSLQVALSGDYDFRIWNRPFRLSMEGYYKYLTHLISYHVDNVQIIYSGENDAKGYTAGLDLKLSGEFIRGTESWISLSLMKTAENLFNDYYIDADDNRVEPGYIPRPTDQLFSINIFFQDHIPFFTPLRVHLNFVFSSGLPYGAPNTQRYQQTLRMPWYRRVDVGFSYMFLEQSRDRMKHKSGFLRSIKSAGVYLEVFNILGINNVSSYIWITDINNTMIAVPNYLTPRLINLKLAIEF